MGEDRGRTTEDRRKESIIEVRFNIPRWLEQLIVFIALPYRRIRYGYAFRRIPLTQGKYAIVDPDDFERLNQYKWHTAKVGNVSYARRMKTTQSGTRASAVMMHREVLKVPYYLLVDHINHNGLDNRKANLRPATITQNSRNRRKVCTQRYRSQYKGLGWYGRKKKWGVKIMVDGRSIFLGYFDNEIDAAKAYDQAAKNYHGDFANPNFPIRHSERSRGIC